MAHAYADLTNPTPGAPKVESSKLGNSLNAFESTVTIAAPAPGIGEKIFWGKLPLGARPQGHLAQMSWSAGAASSTLNLGDNVSAGRHLAATAVNAAGSAVPNAASASGATFRVTDESTVIKADGTLVASATDNAMLVSTVAGAALQVGQVITLRMPYVGR